jgi:hypothetical protein
MMYLPMNLEARMRLAHLFALAAHQRQQLSGSTESYCLLGYVTAFRAHMSSTEQLDPNLSRGS